jgi:hypothetical protein
VVPGCMLCYMFATRFSHNRMRPPSLSYGCVCAKILASQHLPFPLFFPTPASAFFSRFPSFCPLAPFLSRFPSFISAFSLSSSPSDPALDSLSPSFPPSLILLSLSLFSSLPLSPFLSRLSPSDMDPTLVSLYLSLSLSVTDPLHME